MKEIQVAFGLALCLIAPLVQGQFAVFKTVEDVVNETPIQYDGFDYRKTKGGSDVEIVLRNEETREERVVDCATIWGFTYKGELFRVMRHGKYYENGGLNNFPVKLVVVNDVYYWENGYFLDALKEGWTSVSLHPSYTGFVSASLDGDAFLVTGMMKGPGWVEDSAELFFKEHPGTIWLKECVRKRQKRGFLHTDVSNCIKAHPMSQEKNH